MNATKALELLEPIPGDEFITGNFTNGIDKCCSEGHLVRLLSNNPNDYSEPNCMPTSASNGLLWFIHQVTEFYAKQYPEVSVCMTFINDFEHSGYTEPKIKDRVIHLLKDMKKSGY